jgi:hypothetical protein
MAAALHRKPARLPEQVLVNSQQPPRLLIGGASHHHAIDMLEMIRRLLDAGDAAVEQDGKPRMRSLEPVDATIVERRNLAVLTRDSP